MTDAIEAGARAAALVQGDDFDKIPRDKQHWIEDRGQFNGRYRDINEPFQSCYLEMSEEVIKAAIASGALLDTAPASGDYVVVPREPTQAMQKAGDDVWNGMGIPFGDPVDVWNAMLNAASSNGD